MRSSLDHGFKLLAATMLAVSSVWAQQYTWEASLAPDDTLTSVSHTFYAPKKMKYISAKPDDPIIIIRLDRGTVIVVNTRRASYAEVTFDEWRSMRAQQSAMVMEIPPDIQRMPEEQRNRKMQELIREQGSAQQKVEVLKFPDTKSVRGYQCGKFIVKVDNKVGLNVWSTRAVKDFEEMRSDLVEMYRQLAAAYPVMKLFPNALKSIDGFPMEVQQGDVKLTVMKVEKRILGDDEFEPPPGYRRTTPAIPGR